MEKLRIRATDEGGSTFDLRDLLRVLPPRSLEATWTVRRPEGWDFEATGSGGSALEQLAERSGQLAGKDLLSLADDTLQVSWGDFHAVLPSAPDRDWVVIRACDSSFFEVVTEDQDALARLRARFGDAC
jgi:hypothetical protein